MKKAPQKTFLAFKNGLKVYKPRVIMACVHYYVKFKSNISSNYYGLLRKYKLYYSPGSSTKVDIGEKATKLLKKNLPTFFEFTK